MWVGYKSVDVEMMMTMEFSMSSKCGFGHCILALLKQQRERPNLVTDPHNDLLPVGLIV